MITRSNFVRCGVALTLAIAMSACGSRSSYWDSSPAGGTAHGLANGVVLVDDAAHRAVMVSALADQQVAKQSFRIGHNVTSRVTSPDGSRLFVLSAGDWPRRAKSDEYPSLTVIDASTLDPPTVSQYKMSVALPNLAIDPLGDWVVAYAGAGARASFVQNANEIVIFNLKTPGSTPQAIPIRSYGGTPQRLTFTPPLALPNGPGRLLVIETDIDVTLLELDKPLSSEVTVPLTSGKSAQQVTPDGVVVDGLDSTRPEDARIALRARNNRNVFTFTLGPSDTGNDFTPIINVIDVGGVPSDIAFVRTDGPNGPCQSGKPDTCALRVAALVPTTSSAVLVDPDTSITTQVALPAPYAKLSLVTNVVASNTGTDVAMLWNGTNNATPAGASGVAFWILGNAVGQPYFSVESIPVMHPIASVQDVAHNEQLKVLVASDGSGFFVLDLLKRTAAPLITATQATITIAPDGQRLWAFAGGGKELTKLDLACPDPALASCAVLNPVPLATDAAIDEVFDVARRGTGRSLIAIHRQGTMGATVFDALNPDTATAVRIPALLLEAP